MANQDPWPENRCASDALTVQDVESFRSIVDEASDERPLQSLLAARPHLMNCLLPAGRDAWCFDRPRLGSELVPDFLLSTHNSTGYQWRMVELESPTGRILTRAGSPSSKLNTAITQVRDWRSWIRDNIAYAQRELRFLGLDAECHAFIVIGRRHAVLPAQARRYRELSDDRTTIMTYDRLLDSVRTGRPNPRE